MGHNEHPRGEQAEEYPLLITMDAALERLGFGRNTMYKRIADGSLKTVRVGRRRFTTERFLAEFIAALEDAA